MTDEELHAQAIAEGYRDETCPEPKCQTFFAAQIHFIRCDFPTCPMKSTKEPRTLLQIMIDEADAAESTKESPR